MYDAIVVGARCAGSPTAMLLARRGYRVLLLDRATFPSDTFRNHAIMSAGVGLLKDWGLLDRVAASNCPPMRRQTIHMGDYPLVGSPPPREDGVDALYAPRRIVLDQILVDAAVAAGAELREGVAVEGVLREDGRVAGVRARARGGETFEERARLVVGADGQHSAVARFVEAPTVESHPALTCGYYSYFADVPMDGIEVYMRFAADDRRIIIAFPTNDGQVCVAVQWPHARFHEVRADIPGHFWRVLDSQPEIGPRVRAGRRAERWQGTADLPNFYRRGRGPGWALVGDAALHKDPIQAHGITDAFRQAGLLADAADAGLSGREPLDAALARYDAQRVEVTRPGFEENLQSASLLPPPPQVYALRAAIRGHQRAMDRWIGVGFGSVSPAEFAGPEAVARLLAPAG